MRIRVVSLSSVHYNWDTLAIFDNDGREIVIKRKQIAELKHLLSGRTKRQDADYQEAHNP